MSPERRKEIASKGGKCHSKEHMSKIGKKGGKRSGEVRGKGL